jgi:hypothetical protein
MAFSLTIVSPINLDNLIIYKGIVFKTMEALKIWLAEYAMFRHRPFNVKNSDESKCYTVICLRGCPWTVHARRNDGTWRITSVVQPHTCSTNVDDTKYPQLSSRFI